jgi:2-oxoglutarate-dependent dioxygenase
MKTLSSIKSTFEKDGVVSLGQFFDSHEIDKYNELLINLFYNKNGTIRENTADLSKLLDENIGPEATLQVVNAYKYEDRLMELMKNPGILDLVSELVGEEVFLFRDQAFYKPPKFGGEIFMHQDNRYWHLSEPNAVIVWIAFNDATIENGCVHYIKGTHKEWIKHKQALSGNSVQLEAIADKSKSFSLPIKKGGVNIHHCQIVHWSPQNLTNEGRLAYTIAYMGSGIKSDKYPGPYIRLR